MIGKEDKSDYMTQSNLEQLLSTFSGGIAIYKFVDGKIKTLYFSDVLPMMSGYSREEYKQLIHDDAANMVAEEDRKYLMEIVRKAVSEASDCSAILHIYHKTSSPILVSINAKMAGYEDGLPVFHVIFMKMSEESRLYYDIANYATGGIYVIGKENHELLYLNRRMESELQEHDKAHVLGRKCYQVLMGKSHRCDDCVVGRCVPDGKPCERYSKKMDKHLSVVSRDTEWQGQDAVVIYVNDITEAKRTGEEIHQIYNSIPGAVFRCCFNEDWTVLSANDGLFTFLGYTREEFAAMGGKMSAVIYPDDLAVMTGKISAQLESGKTLVENENRLICKDGTVKWISIKAQLLANPDGEQFFYCVFVDITRQKEEALRLKIVENNLEIAMHHAGMMYWEYDIPGSVVYANNATQRCFGLPAAFSNYPESYLKLGFVDAECVETYRDAVAKVRNGADYVEFEARIKTLYRDFEWMRIRLTCVKDPDGTPRRAICTGELIAEYKKLEKRFMTTLRQNNISNWIYDIRGRLIVLNTNTHYAFEHNPENEISNVPESQIQAGLCHPDDVEILRRLYRRIDMGERQVEEQLRFLDSRLKEFRWKKCVYTVIEDNYGNPAYAIGSAIDITDQFEQKRKYESAMEYWKRTQVDNLLLSGHCSITYDRVFEMTDLTGTDLLKNFGNTRESFFLGLESLVLDNDKRKEFHSLFTNEAVKHNFEIGISEADLTCEISLGAGSGRRLWVYIHVSAVNVPETNAIEGFLTMLDVTDSHTQRHILDTVVECDYDYLASINLSADTITLFRKNEQELQLERYVSGRQYSYRGFVEDSLKYRIAEKDKNFLKAHMAPDVIRNSLEKNSVYEFICHTKGNNEEIRVSRVRFASFDRQSDTVVFTRTDVTEMIQQEEQKRIELKNALKAALRSSLVVNTVTNQDYDYIMVVNIAKDTYELYAASADKSMSNMPVSGNYEDQLKRYAEEYILPEDRRIAYDEMRAGYIQDMLREKDIYITYVRLIDKNGLIRHKHCKISYLDESHTHLLITRVDITDIIKNEEQKRNELSRALKLTEQATHAKTDFLSRMSHDLRTPMNVIIGLTALTIDDSKNPDIVCSNMSKLRSTSNFMLSLINDILDMAKIENGTVELHPEPYTYSDFLMNMKTMFTSQCVQKEISLNFEEPSINPVVLADKTRINQIFFNVLSNSVKYTPVGGRIDYAVRNLVIGERTLSADVVVTDTGIGMSEEFQRHMFDPFMQEDTGATPELQGTGLGLSITKQLVEIMGGTIKIESQKDMGTAVTIHLEFEFVSMDSKAIEQKAGVTEDYKQLLADKKVLLVEDHPLNMQIARRLLEKEGISVICAENGREAVEKFSASTAGFFDAVLMDIRMPEMDGYTACRKIRALDRPDSDVPIIAMTANAYPTDIEKSLASGMNSHLAKPIEPNILYRTLAEELPEARVKSSRIAGKNVSGEF